MVKSLICNGNLLDLQYDFSQRLALLSYLRHADDFDAFDSSDAEDELQPFEVPEGLQVAAPPDASQLEYTPGAANLKLRQVLDGRSILFKWGVDRGPVHWHNDRQHGWSAQEGRR